MNHTRRDFLQTMTMATCSTIAELSFRSQPVQTNSYNSAVCLFSKHLPTLNWTQLAKTVKEIGFDGVDLTVRAAGHVLPERAAEDLPKAVTTIKAEGLSVPMITTGLTSASDPTAKLILSTAGKLGIPFFKPGYYKYQLKSVYQELENFGVEFTALTVLSRQTGVQCGFHNHEGNIGAPLWDVARIIDRLDPKWVGYYFDVRHAVVEGGVGGWKIATNLVAPRLKMIAVKDFYWEKSAKGWSVVNCPLGEGMVDWKQYFRLLRQADFRGPISLHLEYEIPGATASEKEKNTIVAAKRDLEFLKAKLLEAYK